MLSNVPAPADVQTFETLERYLEPIGIYMSEVDLTPIPVGVRHCGW